MSVVCSLKMCFDQSVDELMMIFCQLLQVLDRDA